MPKFRKKPVVIEAHQFMPSAGQIPDGVLHDRFDANGNEVYYINTLEGPMGCSPGDWIITGVAGEKYACKPDIFVAMYEEVRDAR